MSQPASLWIRSNRLWWYPRHKHSNGIMNTFYQNMILCCCLLHNTQHKYLYSLSTRAQLASPLWKELCGCMWLAHYLQTEVCIWKIQPLGCWLEWKPIYGSMLFFLHNNVPLTYCGQPYPGHCSVVVFSVYCFSHSGHGTLLLIPSAVVPLYCMTHPAFHYLTSLIVQNYFLLL